MTSFVLELTQIITFLSLLRVWGKIHLQQKWRLDCYMI